LKTIVDCGSGELIDILSWFEDPRFQNSVRPLLIAEEEKEFEKMLNATTQSDADLSRGGIKKLRWLVRLHDIALEELGRRRGTEGDTSENKEEAEGT